jgi:hypothetical protein
VDFYCRAQTLYFQGQFGSFRAKCLEKPTACRMRVWPRVQSKSILYGREVFLYDKRAAGCWLP